MSVIRARTCKFGARGRGNVIVRLPGADPGRGALLVHGHLDVVPADAAEWSVHPFSGEVPVEALEFGTRVLDRFLRTC